MAIMKGGALGAISGKLQGTEFAMNGARTVVKGCKVRRSGTSGAQVNAQTLQRSVYTQWRSMDQRYRNAWEMAARQHPVIDRFGDKATRNGYQLFASMPHDFRFTGVEYWASLPPTLTTNYVFETVALVTTDPSLLCDLDGYSYSGFDFFGGYVSRMCKNETRKPKRWKSLGMFVVNSSPVLIDSSLMDPGLSFIAGEIVALQLFIYKLGTWPIYTETFFTTVV
jgi:hypothetical protein